MPARPQSFSSAREHADLADSPVPREPTDGVLLAELRQVLRTAGYTENGLRGTLGPAAAAGLGSARVELQQRRFSDSGSLSTLAKLFLLGVEVDTATAASALAPIELSSLEAAGLVELHDGQVRSVVRLMPCDDLLVACDHDMRSGEPDFVTGVGPASMTLAHLTVRRPARTALDLGAGGGIQALLAARHSDEVVAAEISPRALAFAALNARMNGFPNIGLERGSWFEPVERRRFDLIVANPPYVVSPDARLVYRDSGDPGDSLCRRIVTGMPDYLSEDGFGHVLCNWVHAAAESPSAPVEAWAEGTLCDALVLCYASEDPLSYAMRWNELLRESDPVAHEQTLDRWCRYYEEHGIERIAAGCVILRRRSNGPNWIRTVYSQAAPSGPSGEHVARLFDGHDYVASLDSDRDLLGAVFRPVDGQRLDQALTYRDGGYQAAPATVRLHPGAGLEASVEPEALEVVLGCASGQRLGDVVRDLAEAREGDREQLTELSIATVRELVQLGFLVAGGDGTD